MSLDMKIALDKQNVCWRGITYLQYSGVTSTVYSGIRLRPYTYVL